jgi:hypothetical protein
VNEKWVSLKTAQRAVEVLSRVLGDDLAVFPDVDGCAETASRSAGVQSRLLQRASYAVSEFFVSGSSIHEVAGRYPFLSLFCLNFRISPKHPQVADRS